MLRPTQIAYVFVFCFISLGPAGIAQTNKSQGGPPRKSKKSIQVINATRDNAGEHPGTAATTGPARITCIRATTDMFNSQIQPSCYVVSPGYVGPLATGPDHTVGTSGPGTVRLTCNGQGNKLACSASIQQ